MAGLNGTGLVGDDLWLLGHDERTGRRHVPARDLGLGLAGALLGELALQGAIRVRGGVVISVRTQLPAGDDVAGKALKAMLGEREHLPVRDWLLFLARTAEADVGSRLAAAGFVTQTRSSWWGRAPRLVPVDPDSAFAPLLRVKAAVDARSPVPAGYVLLGRLATACGLSHQISLYLPPGARRHLDQAASYLDPGLRELIVTTQTTVDGAVLTQRT
jgi:hypothetical protein